MKRGRQKLDAILQFAAARRRLVRGILLAGLVALVAPLYAQDAATQPAETGVRGFERAAFVTIHGEINDVLHDSLERRIAEAREQGADVIVFEMDTPGGLVTSALDISKMIKRLSDEGVHTVAWVNDQAYSAGALISVAANEILLTGTASIGDCAPIMIVPGGGLEELGEAERAKAESPILQEFRDSARRNGYDLLLSSAMVSVGVEAWWVEDVETGRRFFIDGDEKKLKIDDLPAEERKIRLVEAYTDPIGGREMRIQQPIDRAKELLTMSASEAVVYGFAKGVANSASEVEQYLGAPGGSARFDTTGWENFALWMNSPLVRGILFVIVLLGAYIEFQSPGLILPGATALIALGLFFGAPYAAGLADIWTIVLLVLGIGLLAVEVFVLPGFGVAGIAGIALVAISFIATFVPSEPGAPPFAWPQLQGTWEAIQTGIIVLSCSVIIAVVGMVLLARYLPTTPFAKPLILENPPLAATDIGPDPRAELALIGDVGLVVADLRPGGQARFGQEIVDVHSQGEYVEAGHRVQVLRHEGMRIIVRPLQDESNA